MALATGDGSTAGAAATAFAGLPAQWLVRSYLPQVTLLRQAALAVTHAGNNSVTEALACGVPVLALPFSTDQFAGAHAIEAAGLGEALDPNTASVEQLRGAIVRIRGSLAPALASALAAVLNLTPGPATARAFLTATPEAPYLP